MEWEQGLEDYVREQPIKSLLIAAGVGMLMGTRVRGQMIGELPRLRDALDREGNLKPSVDFRSVYSSLLEQWFDFDAAGAIANAKAYRRLQLVR